MMIKHAKWVTKIGPETIPPFQTAIVRAEPRIMMRPKYLINLGDAEGLILHRIFIRSGWNREIERPLEYFGRGGASVSLTTIDAEGWFTFQVENKSDQPRRFEMAIEGPAMEE